MKIKIEMDGIVRYDYGTLIVEAPDIGHIKGISEEDLAELLPEENRQGPDAYDSSTDFEVHTIQALDADNEDDVDAYFLNGQILTEEQYRAYEEAEHRRLLDAIPTAQLVLPCCKEK